MAGKLTPKQEAFCLAYIETGNASEAYRQAYDAENMKPATVNRNAKALLDNSKISTRVEALQAEHQERHNITVDGLTEELEQARILAMADPKGAGAAVTAIMGKAKLHGLVMDRMKMTSEVTQRYVAEMPAVIPDSEEWLRQYAPLIQQPQPAPSDRD